MASFTLSFEIVVMDLEGGAKISEDPEDSGGLTKFGISLSAYPSLGRDGILSLTKTKAKDIYKNDYWLAVRCPEFPLFSRLCVFDTSVNHGLLGGSKIVQRALNTLGNSLVVDGQVGPRTLAAAAKADPIQLVLAILEERQRFYRSLENYPRFGRGWERRILRIGIES
jgi:lysozyme family protein